MMSWIKTKLHQKRAPGLGRQRVHLKLINAALYNNVKQLIEYSKRTGIPLDEVMGY